MKMRKALSQFFLIIMLVVSALVLIQAPAQAATWEVWTDVKESTKSFINATGKTNTKPNSETSTGNIFTFILNTANLNILGGKTTGEVAGLSSEESLALEKTAGPGLITSINRGIIATYTPPASAETYVADLMNSAKIIPQAQAQGLGFSALDPILETWKAFRNLAYLFFVVIFLGIGFMIMFRAKVGQAAITAQQAIPSVIVAMLAVTFSYAIAGLMIDLMYVVMYMLASLFSEGPDVITRNMLGLVGLMFQGTDGVQETIEQFMEDALNIGWLGEALAWLSSLLGSVIVGVAVLFASFKVFFELIKTYVAVLVQIIFSPIILMFGAIPGKNTFGKWVKDLAGNLLIWPVVLLCILVQRMLTAPIRAIQGTGNTLDSAFGGGFMPPFLVGQGQGAILPVIIGLGVLLVIPEIIQQVKKAMGVEEGVFGALAGSAWKNLQQAPSNLLKTSEVAIPAGLMAAGGINDARLARLDYMANTGKDRSTLGMIKHMAFGNALPEGTELRSQGMFAGASKGFKRGQDINTTISDLLTKNPLKRDLAGEYYRNATNNKKDTEKKEGKGTEKSPQSAGEEGSS